MEKGNKARKKERTKEKRTKKVKRNNKNEKGICERVKLLNKIANERENK